MRFSTRLLSLSTTRLSAVHRGVAFEERSLKILQDHLSMSLRRVGGRSDGGIDLLGWWWLPAIHTGPTNTPVYTSNEGDARRRLRILCQCKAEKKKMGPNYVREMEGVLHRYISVSKTSPALPSAPQDQPPPYPLVALLISESPFTKATLLRAQSSPIPFFLLHIPPAAGPPPPVDHDESQHSIGVAFWNPALAGVRGLLGGEVEVRWERASDHGRPGLWWCGRRLRSWTPGGDGGGSGVDGEDRDKFLEELAREGLEALP